MEIAEEEAELAGALAVTWGAQGLVDFPRLHLPFKRLLSSTGASVAALPGAPEGPGTAAVGTTGWSPIAGGNERLLAQLRELTAKRWTVTVCADNETSAQRLAISLRDEGFTAPVAAEAGKRTFCCSGTHRPGLYLPGPRNGGVGRERPHRPPAPAPHGPAPGGGVPTFFDDMKTGDYVVHFQHEDMLPLSLPLRLF